MAFLAVQKLPGPPEVNVFGECGPCFVRLQCTLYVEGYRSFFISLLRLIDWLGCVGEHGVVHGSTLSQCAPLWRGYPFFLHFPR